MKIALVTDAWLPQVNGVVTTFRQTSQHLEELGHELTRISPEQFRTVPCPGYAEIRLAMVPGRRVARILERAKPDAVHIATEGPLGIAARRWCMDHDFPFASSYHTRFPEYLRLRAPIPLALSYAVLRRFHASAYSTLVRTATQKRLLEARGFNGVSIWPGAVDCELFRPLGKDALALPRPISMYMGRVAVEKNLEQFLDLELPGTQVVVGGGPDFGKLRKKYPAAVFTGPLFGVELAKTLSAADVFVFPSRTDTLGLVMLEAMACGVPVAAFPVPGPADLLTEGSTGAMDEDLRAAIFRALALDGEACIEFAREHSWRRSTETFLLFQCRRAHKAATPEQPNYCPPDTHLNQGW